MFSLFQFISPKSFSLMVIPELRHHLTHWHLIFFFIWKLLTKYTQMLSFGVYCFISICICTWSINIISIFLLPSGVTLWCIPHIWFPVIKTSFICLMPLALKASLSPFFFQYSKVVPHLIFNKAKFLIHGNK